MKEKEQNSNIFLFVSILFVTCLLISNTCAYKVMQLGPFSITSGALIFPISYIVNDLIAEVYGYSKAKKVIWFGFAMNALMVLYYEIAILVPGASYFEGQEAFATVLGGTGRVLGASFIAYLSGSFLNAAVLSKLKVKTNGKWLMLRAIASTFVGELVDSILFVTLVFAFVYDINSILIMIGTQTLLKTVYEIIIFPITNIIIKKVKRVEGLDTYDNNISYNPFRLKGGR